jgi:hypothetical protein
MSSDQHYCRLWTVALSIYVIFNAFVGGKPQPTFGENSFLPLPLGAFGALQVWLGVLTLLRPTSPFRLVAMLLFLLFRILGEMPYTVNHFVLLLLLVLAQLTALAQAALHARYRDSSAPPNDVVVEAFCRFAPTGRLLVLMLYAFAGLHKLNTAYFDPSASVACRVYNLTLHPLLPRGDWVRWPVMVGSAATELVIPFLLGPIRTRTFGVVLGVAFHLLLSLHVNVLDFQVLMMACLTLFLPERFTLALVPRGLGSPESGWARAARDSAIALTCAAAFLRLERTLRGEAEAQDVHVVLQDVHDKMVLWVKPLFYGIVAFAVIRAVLHAKRSGGQGACQQSPVGVLNAFRTGPAMIVWPALMLLVGLNPYLGLRTVPCFSMFSNLRTEGGKNNHLFMPRLRLFSYQDDLVTVLRTSSKLKAYFPAAPRRITWFELQRAAAADSSPGFWVEYSRNAEKVVRVSRAETPAHELFRAPPAILRKVLAFRPVNPDDAPEPGGW